jgi:DNA-binding NarL/FixJ family response regulator
VAESPHTRVLVLTTYDLDEYLLDAIHAGASGFLVKDVRPEQLPPAVRAVHAGDTLVGSQTTRRLIEAFIHQPSPQTVPGLSLLTERERGILIHIAHGLTNTEIASMIHLAETTVKTHIGRILAKLQARDRVHLVILAYQAGLVRPDQPAG